MLTLEEAKELPYRSVLVADNGKRWYVSGKVQVWKRDANRIRIPLKHGLYAYGHLDERDFPGGKCEWMTRE